MPRKIRAVFFDLDNTLVDFLRFKRMCLEGSVEAMIDTGLKIEKEEALRKLYELYEKYGMEYKHIFDDFLRETMGEPDPKILAAAIVAYRQRRISFLEPYPHVIPTLLELMRRGIKLGIITDAPKLKAWLRLCTLKLHHFFKIVVTLDDTGKRKPSPEPFLLGIELAGVKPQECLYIGDREDVDIFGAKKVGMLTCFAKYGGAEYKGAVVSDYVIEDFEELLEIIK